MTLTSTTRPFGMREIKVAAFPTGTPIALPAAQTLSFSEVLTEGELRGNDATVAVAAYTDKTEWELESGGISLEALAIMSGRTIALTGTTPNQKNTLSIKAGDIMPYFRIFGKSVSDDGSDVHVQIRKAKLTGGIEGEFADGEFFVQSCSGIGVSDGTAIVDFVHNETTAALPTS